jgi:hypothetical protein
MRFEEVLRLFGEFFTVENIRYAVVGGLAVHSWGGSRLTKDTDIAVDRLNQNRVVAFAESRGFETLSVREAFSNHLLAPNTRLDFMYLDGTTAERVFDASIVRPVIGDVVAPVASPEHLAMMKAMAMKNFPHRALFEGEDVRQLMSVPGVDREAVRDYYRRNGLLELFDAIEKAR